MRIFLALMLAISPFTVNAETWYQKQVKQRVAFDNAVHAWAEGVGNLNATRGALRGTGSLSCSKAFRHSQRTHCFTMKITDSGVTNMVLIAVPTRWYENAARYDTIFLQRVPRCAGPQMPMWVARKYVRRLKRC